MLFIRLVRIQLGIVTLESLIKYINMINSNDIVIGDALYYASPIGHIPIIRGELL